MKLEKLIFVMVLVLCSSAINAQTLDVKTELPGKFGIAFVPQYAIYDGMRIDMDFRIKPDQYLTIAPIFYYGKNSSVFYPSSTDMTGAGLTLNYRYFPGKKSQPNGGYLGIGIGYKYIQTEYSSNDYYTYLEDQLPYISYGLTQKKAHFNQFGYNILLGYQLILADNFLFDVYTGWGFRASGFDPDKPGNDSFWSETIFDPGYSGFLPLVGFRFGILLN